jgi:hypothetical protein
MKMEEIEDEVADPQSQINPITGKAKADFELPKLDTFNQGGAQSFMP